jgi:hypothetical protein
MGLIGLMCPERGEPPNRQPQTANRQPLTPERETEDQGAPDYTHTRSDPPAHD